MIENMMHNDRVRLWWNGEEIPAADWRKADWTYHMRQRHPKSYRGYRLHVDLRGKRLPKVGQNSVRVDVLKKDAKLVQSINLVEVEVRVDYLSHRIGVLPDER